jgi:three-Cys-motif partner protein
MKKPSDKKVYRLPEHSLAKIKCYSKYLEIYLAVLANTPFNKIKIYDFFSGEGRDIDGKASSSIEAIEVIYNHYKSTNKHCQQIDIFLNEPGKSVIEENLSKIDRIKNFAQEFILPKNVRIKYESKFFEDVIHDVIKELSKLSPFERALCFIDPFGYKYTKPEIIKELMQNGQTEIILFIPISFMHRFAAKAINDDDFIEGRHIEEFINVLYNEKIPDLKSQVSFIKSMQAQFRIFLGIEYVDVMFIEKSLNQYFSLFFFSNSKRGFHKMLEAKWKVDENNGHGFSVQRSFLKPSLFENIDYEDYSYLLYNELKRRKIMSNQEIFDFGLKNNHLPKHSKKVLEELKNEGHVTVSFPDGTKSSHFYIEDNHEKKVIIKSI